MHLLLVIHALQPSGSAVAGPDKVTLIVTMARGVTVAWHGDDPAQSRRNAEGRGFSTGSLDLHVIKVLPRRGDYFVIGV